MQLLQPFEFYSGKYCNLEDSYSAVGKELMGIVSASNQPQSPVLKFLARMQPFWISMGNIYQIFSIIPSAFILYVIPVFILFVIPVFLAKKLSSERR